MLHRSVSQAWLALLLHLFSAVGALNVVGLPPGNQSALTGSHRAGRKVPTWSKSKPHSKRHHYTKVPDGDIDMEERPDFGSVVKIFDLEGVPIHWHAFIWLSIFLSLSIVSIIFYCCFLYLPEQGDAFQGGGAGSLRPASPSKPAEDAATRERSASCSSPAEDSAPSKQTSAATLPGGGEGDDGAVARFSSRNLDDVKDQRELQVEKERLQAQGLTRKPRRRSWHLVRDWAELRTETWSTRDSHETMGAPAFVCNIVADLCPSGFISIAYGMDGIGYAPACAVLLVSYLLSCYTMWMVGRTCEITGEYDFASQWATSIGPGGKWVPNLVICTVAIGALLCYACYFGDLLQEVTPAFGFAVPRYACVMGASLFPALPLCYLKNLSALAYSSGFAVLSLIYTATVMSVRAFDGTYAKGGYFFQELPLSLRPDLPAETPIWHLGGSSLVYINILAMAFHCHCNACKYYRELHKSTPGHFFRCTLLAMGICACIYAAMGFMGFKTFGYAAEGTILKNYSINDWPVNIAKLGIVFSLIASYGIMFAALRESSVSLLQSVCARWGHSFDLIWRQDLLSTSWVALITLLAVLLEDSGLVDGFVGAFCGNAVIYIIPGLLYAASVKAFFESSRNAPSLASSIGLVILGIVLSVAGCLCVIYFELPKADTQFKDVAIYSREGARAMPHDPGGRIPGDGGVSHVWNHRGRRYFWFR